MLVIVCWLSCFSHLSLFSIIGEVRQIHGSSVGEVLDFVHIGLSILNMHIYVSFITSYVTFPNNKTLIDMIK